MEPDMLRGRSVRSTITMPYRVPSIVLALSLFHASTATAATYFVRQSGDDEHVGSMPGKAWATLTKAARTVRAGDTVLVGGGTFDGPLPIANSGTKDAAIVFVADTRGEFTGDAGPCVVTSSRGSVVILEEKSHVQFRGLSFRGTNGLIVNARRASGI